MITNVIADFWKMTKQDSITYTHTTSVQIFSSFSSSNNCVTTTKSTCLNIYLIFVVVVEYLLLLCFFLFKIHWFTLLECLYHFHHHHLYIYFEWKKNKIKSHCLNTHTHTVNKIVSLFLSIFFLFSITIPFSIQTHKPLLPVDCIQFDCFYIYPSIHPSIYISIYLSIYPLSLLSFFSII